MENPSCLLYGPGDVRFEDRPMPVIEDGNDVIIRIAYVGVCGSDVCSIQRICHNTNKCVPSNKFNPLGPLLAPRRHQKPRLSDKSASNGPRSLRYRARRRARCDNPQTRRPDSHRARIRLSQLHTMQERQIQPLPGYEVRRKPAAYTRRSV